MDQNLAIYGQVDWWNPRHSLARMAPVKFAYFHERIGSLEGKRILDVGCGGGLVAEEFAKRGAFVTGIDLSEKALQAAREHAEAGGLAIRYELGRAEDLGFDQGAFDVVVFADSLEHVDDLELAIGHASRVLRDGGVLCYDTVNGNLFTKLAVRWVVDPIIRWEYRRLNVSEQGYAIHDPKRFIRPEALIGLMARHGLVNLDIRGLRFAGFCRHGFKVRICGVPGMAYIGCAEKR